MTYPSSRNGFTNAEILIAVSLVGLLAAFAIPKLCSLGNNPETMAKERRVIEEDLRRGFETFEVQQGLIPRTISPSQVIALSLNVASQEIINNSSDLPTLCRQTALPATKFQLKNSRWIAYASNQWTNETDRSRDASSLCVVSSNNAENAGTIAILRHGESMIASNSLSSVPSDDGDGGEPLAPSDPDSLNDLEDPSGPPVQPPPPNPNNGGVVQWRAVATDTHELSGIKVVFLTYKGKEYRVSQQEFTSNVRIDWSNSRAVLTKMGVPKSLFPKNLSNLSYKQALQFGERVANYKDVGLHASFKTGPNLGLLRLSAPGMLNLNELLMSNHQQPGNGGVASEREDTGYKVRFMGDLDQDGQPDNAQLDGWANYGGPFDSLAANKNNKVIGVNHADNWDHDSQFEGLSSEQISYVKSLSFSGGNLGGGHLIKNNQVGKK